MDGGRATVAADVSVLLPARAAYQRWAATYATSGRNPLTQLAEDTFNELAPDLAGRCVLDVGTGDGRYARLAVADGAAWVAGVDFSAAMLARARAAGTDRLSAADMAALPFATGSVDVVSHVLVLGHTPRPAVALAEAARVLAPGGQLVLVDIHPATVHRGWRRTFRDARGQPFAVLWHAHSLAELAYGLTVADLELVTLVEPTLDPISLPDPPPPGALGGPALYGLLARKPA